MDGGGRNDFSGSTEGHVVQVAGDVHGGVHIRAAAVQEGVVPRQVPPGPGQFVNRGGVLDALERLWSEGPDGDGNTGFSALLTGPPGAGKRAVVRRWAHSDPGRFPGGELYLDFAELRRDSDGAGADVWAGVSRCLRSLGLRDEHLPTAPAELAALFRSRTAGERMLVVLENVTSSAQVRALTPGSSGSVVLASGGARLGELTMSGVRLMSLEPLEPGHAVRLLESVCGEERVAAEPGAAARIVEYCAGLPVALRVAAAQLLTYYEEQPVSALADALADEKGRLEALEMGEERPVAAVLGVAYEGLPDGAARLYRLLGLYPGRRWDVPTAAAVAGLPGPQARKQLRKLQDASLVTVVDSAGGTVRYAFHSLVGLHAREQADGRQEGEVVERAAGHLLRRAAQADLAVMGRRLRAGQYVERLAQEPQSGPGRTEASTGASADGFSSGDEALAWLDGERADLLSVLRAASAHGLHRYTADLAEALTALYLNYRYTNDWKEAGTLGVRAAAALGEPAVEARLRCLLSRPLMDLGEGEQARHELETAVARADESGWLLLRASAREFHGRYWDRYGPSHAVPVYEEALGLYEADGDARGTAIGLYFLGRAQDAAGQHDAALTTLTGAHDRFMQPEVGDRRMGGRALAALGVALRSLGRTAGATDALERAVLMLRDCRAVHYEAQAREVLAEIAGEREDFTARRAHLERALEIHSESGSPRAAELRAQLPLSGEDGGTDGAGDPGTETGPASS